MANGSYRNVNYGFGNPLNQAAPVSVIAKRAPKSSDVGFPLCTIWDFKTSNLLYILTSVVANSATWLAITSGGGAGAFTTLTSTGNTTLASGAGASFTAGNATGTTTLLGTVNVNVAGADSTSIGNATGTIALVGANNTLTGNLTASSYLSGSTLYATGDAGGLVATNALTDVSVPVAGGTGAFTITSATTAGAAVNAGFLKFYVGTTAVFVPYYTTTA